MAMKEGTLFDIKSLRTITGNTADFNELAKDCVAFANAKGGHIHIGIEDGCSLPPERQFIGQELADKLSRRMNELTVNVAVRSEILKAENGSNFIDLEIFPSLNAIASTSKGSYYYRDDDKSRPLLPDELHRLLNDKPSYCWETKVSLKYQANQCDSDKLKWLLTSLRASDRVSDFVKEKSDDQLLEYYSLVDEKGWMTNLGVMWIGTQTQRSRLLYSPVVQYLKYDEDGNRINKIVWDDYQLNPAELLTDIWSKVPEWREFVEISEGLWRKQIANYDEKVVREVLCNAIVHRPYTTRGDIFINMFPDRMEIVNPGLFPIGVTPDNILQKRVKRN
ncbi:MAG: putative DNA binding domain-containing protein, partial [Bacteroidales bacterium]|nr:putative DNA binding domain-containing protein [Bacteroidales bacterium]